MDIYADRLSENISNVCNSYQIEPFIPKVNPSINVLAARTRMRLARYWAYPRQVKHLRNSKNALFHIIDHGYAHLLLVLDPARTIVTVHDIIPFLWGRGLIPGADKVRRQWLNEYTLQFLSKAAHVITDSENTRSDVIRYCGCHNNNVSVVHLGVSDSFKPQAEDKAALRQSLGLPNTDSHMVLISGEAFYKNVSTSYQALERLQTLTRKPVILVHLRAALEQIKPPSSLRLGSDVIELSNLNQQQLVSLYNAVDCLLFPSLYEGFGLPPLEAMACGIPVVASNTASLTEIVGRGGLLTDPFDIEAMAQSIQRLVEDDDYRTAQINLGYQHARQFSWQKCAQQTCAIYDKVSSSFVS